MRNELLNGELFHSVTEARVVIGDWVDRYNHVRPHRGLRMKTPARYAADHRRTVGKNESRKGGA
jgi:transposase InsO family protein